MSIDVNEWAWRRNKTVTSVELTQFQIDLIRAVIADELPNIAKAVMNTPLDKLGEPVACDTFAEAFAPQPEAAGDVPEWCESVARENLQAAGIGGHTRDFVLDRQAARIRDAAESELSRRVAEAVAEKDKRIAELKDAIKLHRSQKADDRCIEDDDRLYEALGDGIKCDRRVGSRCDMLANCMRFIRHRTVEGGPWVSYAELEQQLAAAQAEVERLKNARCRIMSKGDQCDCTLCKQDAELAKLRAEVSRLKDMSNFEERANAWSLVWKTCNEVGMDSFKCNEYSGQGMAVAFIKHLASEVSRLTRPVEGVDWGALAVDFANMRGHGNNYRRILDYIIKPRFDAERNAREAAERERDELREAVNMNWNVIQCESGYRVNLKGVNFSDLFSTKADAVLAAYRAEKGKVQA